MLARSAGTTAFALTALLLLASAAGAQDAEILSWEQSFTLNEDGSLVLREHRRVRLNSSRAYREFADPRIDYEEGRETVKILKAVTHLTNGTVLPVPDYSLNLASPGDVVGWPAWSAWRQRIVTFSGLEPGVVVELDYEITSVPRVHRWLEAELRLSSRYPTSGRKITVVLPKGTKLRYAFSGGRPASHLKSFTETGIRHQWAFESFPAEPEEAQSAPWRERCARLAFTTLADADDLDRSILNTIERTSVGAKDIEALAKSATEGETKAKEQAAKLAKVLKDTINVVGSRKTWRSHGFRPAEIVLREGYASPPEAASLMMALLTELGHTAVPVLLIDEDLWSDEVPGTWAIRDFLVMIDREGAPIFVHPTGGPLKPGGEHRNLVVHDALSEESPRVIRLLPHEGLPNGVLLKGRLTVDTAGKLSGRLELRADGRFVDPQAIGPEAGRKSFLAGVAGKLVPGLAVTSHTIEKLTADEFRVTFTVKLDKPWMKHGKTILLRLGDGLLSQAVFPLPLSRPHRQTDVRLAGSFVEAVNVEIDFPKGWKADLLPALSHESGAWGMVSQNLQVLDDRVHLTRFIRLNETIPVDDFPDVRRAINDLRSAAARTLAFRPADPNSEGSASSEPR